MHAGQGRGQGQQGRAAGRTTVVRDTAGLVVALLTQRLARVGMPASAPPSAWLAPPSAGPAPVCKGSLRRWGHSTPPNPHPHTTLTSAPPNVTKAEHSCSWHCCPQHPLLSSTGHTSGGARSAAAAGAVASAAAGHEPPRRRSSTSAASSALILVVPLRCWSCLCRIQHCCGLAGLITESPSQVRAMGRLLVVCI